MLKTITWYKNNSFLTHFYSFRERNFTFYIEHCNPFTLTINDLS